MKKIVKLFILICVCFIPMMVDAKASFELEAEMDNKLLLDIADGEYTFADANYDDTEVGSVVVFGSEGEIIKKASLTPDNTDDLEVVLNSPYVKMYLKLLYDIEGFSIVEDDTGSYVTEFSTERISFNNIATGETGEFSFNENLELTRKVLGKKYDAFLEIKKSDITVNNIKEYNGFFIVYYYDDNGDYVSIMDSNYDVIKTFEGSDAYFNDVYYVYDNLIYVLKNYTDMEIYKVDGTLYQKYKIENDKIGSVHSCDGLRPAKMLIENNKLFILFFPIQCDQRVVSYDAEDLVKEMEASSNFLTLVYNLNYEIEKVETSNGDFTYTSKFDDDGREYVELKISPLKGYSVEDIIVTDINGKRIEVTNNRFYMPISDVRIEVKFGEYIPIPDTFSNISPLIKVFAVILITLGMCIMGFSLKSKKVK